MRISSKSVSKSVKNKSFDNRSILSSDYIFSKKGMIKKKRNKNSYMDVFLEKRRMAAEFAQSKICYSTKSNKKNIINIRNNRLYLHGIQEIININNLKNNLPGSAKSIIDNTNHTNNNTYSNKFFIQRNNDLSFINTNKPKNNTDLSYNIPEDVNYLKNISNKKNFSNNKLLNVPFALDNDENEETSKFANKIIDTNKSRKMGIISTRFTENENEQFYIENNKEINNLELSNCINNADKIDHNNNNIKIKNINTYVKKRPKKDDNFLIVTLRKNNQIDNNSSNQITNSISFRNDLNNINEKKNKDKNKDNNNKNKKVDINEEFHMKYKEENKKDINRYIETNNEDTDNNNINLFNKSNKDKNNELNKINNININENNNTDSNELSNELIEEINIIESIGDKEGEISFENKNNNLDKNKNKKDFLFCNKDNLLEKDENHIKNDKTEGIKNMNRHMSNNAQNYLVENQEKSDNETKNKTNELQKNNSTTYKDMLVHKINENKQFIIKNKSFVDDAIQITSKNLNIPKINITHPTKNNIEENKIYGEEIIFKNYKSDKNKNNNKNINFNNIDNENDNTLYNKKNKKINNLSILSNKIEKFKQLKKNAQKAKEESTYYNEINNLIRKIKEKRDNKNNLINMNKENEENKDIYLETKNNHKDFNSFKNKINSVLNSKDEDDNTNILMNNHNNYNKKCNIMNYNNNIKNKVKNVNNYKISISTRIQNLLKNINNQKMSNNLNNLEDNNDTNTIFTQNVINSINNFSNRSIEEDTTKKINNINDINKINCNNQNNNFILLQNYYHNENNNKNNKKYIKAKSNYITKNYGPSNEMNSPTDINFISDDNTDNNIKFFDEKIFKNMKTRHTRLCKSKPIISLNSIFDNENSKSNISNNISGINSKKYNRHVSGSYADNHLYLDKVREDYLKRNNNNNIFGIERYITKNKRNSVYTNLYRINNINKKTNHYNKNNNYDYNIMPVNNFKGIFKPLIF